MEVLEKLRSGVGRLMQKYAVQTCKYCSEVQVRPKGHRVWQSQAYKHQMRDGQHAWQGATIDDLIQPVYACHILNTHNSLLVDALNRCHGKLPAVVELFAQAEAKIRGNYRGMTTEDVHAASVVHI